MTALQTLIGDALSSSVISLAPLSGGCVSQVMRAELEDGRHVVAKVETGVGEQDGDQASDKAVEKLGDQAGDGPGKRAPTALEREASMLDTLRAAGWPVPQVLYCRPTLLLMEYVDHDGREGAAGQQSAAELLARLHGVPQSGFGCTGDTVIAGLPQTNRVQSQWIPFFAEQRLIAMARQAEARGHLDPADRKRVEALAGRLDRWLLEPEYPSLIHGDLWGGNILFHDGGVAAVIDPACYWAHAEVELAFTTLFGTFGDAFFSRYEELRPIAAGFFEERRDLYNLYPLLVHLRLFGGSYAGAVEGTLQRFGV